MKINDVELEFDFFDADSLELYDKHAVILKDKAKALDKEELSVPDKIRKLCKIQFVFLDSVFGENTSNKLFGTKCSLRDKVRVIEDIAKERDTQASEIQAFTTKYSSNRAERRK
jgi:hypothetical protein